MRITTRENGGILVIPDVPEGQWLERARKAMVLIDEAEEIGFRIQKMNCDFWIEGFICYASNMLNITLNMDSPQPSDVHEVCNLIRIHQVDHKMPADIPETVYLRLSEAQKAVYLLTIFLIDKATKNHDGHRIKMAVELKTITKKEISHNVAI